MKRTAAKAILAAYMFFIIFLSLRPGSMPLSGVWNVDKVYHFLAYAVMGFLWTWTLRGGLAGRAGLAGRGGPATRRIVAAAFVISALFGVLMEVLQHFVPPRTAEVTDALANALGAIFGAMVAARALKAEGR